MIFVFWKLWQNPAFSRLFTCFLCSKGAGEFESLDYLKCWGYKPLYLLRPTFASFDLNWMNSLKVEVAVAEFPSRPLTIKLKKMTKFVLSSSPYYTKVIWSLFRIWGICIHIKAIIVSSQKMPIVLTYIWKILNKEKVTRWRRMSAELDSQRETEEGCGAVGGKSEDVEMHKRAWDWQTHWRRNCVNHSHTAAAILPGNCCKHPRSLHLGAWPWWTTTLCTFWLGARASLCLHKIEMPEPSFGVMQQSAAWKFLNITRHLSEEAVVINCPTNASNHQTSESPTFWGLALS